MRITGGPPAAVRGTSSAHDGTVPRRAAGASRRSAPMVSARLRIDRRPCGRGARVRQSRPVVADAIDAAVAVARRASTSMRVGAGVAHGVGQRLGGDAVDVGGDERRQGGQACRVTSIARRRRDAPARAARSRSSTVDRAAVERRAQLGDARVHVGVAPRSSRAPGRRSRAARPAGAPSSALSTRCAACTRCLAESCSSQAMRWRSACDARAARSARARRARRRAASPA